MDREFFAAGHDHAMHQKSAISIPVLCEPIKKSTKIAKKDH
jgi:hypothetical protein